MPPTIRNYRLNLSHLPATNADYETLASFALTYYCHTKDGSISNDDLFRDEPPLTSGLNELRAWLFLRQRSIRGGYVGNPDDDPELLAPLRRTVEAIRERLTTSPPGLHAMRRAAYFEYLGAPLHNTRWSWGAVRTADGVVFLLVWKDQIRVQEGRNFARLVRRTDRTASVLPGASEREGHLEQFRSGTPCYLILGEAVDPRAKPRKVLSFNPDVLYPAGKLVQHDGGWYAEMLDGRPVGEIVTSRGT